MAHDPTHATLRQQYPVLREQFETSRALLAGARQRAQRVAEETMAMRNLLRERRRNRAVVAQPDREVWAAAARVIADAARDRDRVIGVLAHELRQALGAAVTAERLLVGGAEGATADRAAAVLDRQLLHLARLVDTLLDYSRLSIGNAALEDEPCDVRNIVREALESVEARVREKRQELLVEDCGEPLIVRADRTRLRQLFSNLLQNAVRYTPEGGRIECSTAGAGDRVRIRVRDTGCGIAPEDQARIFEPFVRGSEAGGGLGVGLALARRIAELHGGQLHVESDGAGAGAAFTTVLPRSTTRP